MQGAGNRTYMIGHCIEQFTLKPDRYYAPAKVNDSMETAVRYFCAACDLIQRLINYDIKDEFSPFQMDFCMYFGKQSKRNVETEENNELLGIDEFDVEFANEKYKRSDLIFSTETMVNAFISYHGAIVEVSKDIVNLLVMFVGNSTCFGHTKMLSELYDRFKQTLKDNSHPEYKRFILLVDRKGGDKRCFDDVWLYQPKKTD